MSRAERARWFGAGALSVALAVTVYEGRVSLANSHGAQRVSLGAGEAATVDAQGQIRRQSAPTSASAHAQNTAPQGASATPEAADTPRPREPASPTEVERLRRLLIGNGISPESGERLSGATTADGHRRGIDNDGDTDLTPAEWRLLAERGELRFAIPGGQRPDPLDSNRARALNLPDATAEEANAALNAGSQRLMRELRALYREAVGTDAGSMSTQALVQEVRDKTPDETVSQVNFTLAQERGGLSAPQEPRPDMPPYERMMRLLVGYEASLERDLAPLVGAATAHAMIHGENAISRHAYGMGARGHHPAP